MDAFAVAILLATANERLIEYLIRPLQRKFSHLDWWFVPYVSFASGLLIGWFSGVDLFGEWIQQPVLTHILTAALIAGGSELIHSIFNRLKKEQGA